MHQRYARRSSGRKLSFALSLAFLCAHAGAQVYRCGNTYTQEPCKGGRTVETSPILSDPRGPATKEIHLCSAPQGKQYWIPEHCAQRGWSIERIQRVPANVPWADQVAAASEQMRAAQALTVAPAAQSIPQTPQPSPRQHCSLLDERVKQLDSMGRAGSLHYDLNWVRRERKEARDQQFRLRC